MARRSKDEAEETKEHILDAAIRLFLRDGVAHTTLEKIAAEAGYTRGAVYHHFDNKATLLLELLKEVHPPAEGMFNSVRVACTTDPLGALHEALNKQLVLMLSNKRVREVHTIFIHNCEFVEKENPIFESECHFAKQTMDLIREALTHAQALGQMRTDISPDQASVMLHAYCFGIYSMALRDTFTSTEDVGKISMEKAMDIFFRGLLKNAEPPSSK